MSSEAVTRKHEASPLLAAFIMLQSRYAALGLAEYFAGLRALSLGYGVGSRAELIAVCQTLWAKSLDQQLQIREILEMTLPTQLPSENLDRIYNDLERVAPSETEREQRPQAPISKPGDGERGGARAPDTKTDRDDLNLSWQPGTAKRGIAEPALPNIAYNPRLEFTPHLPVTRRHMTRAWRYFRRMKAVGQPVELDVERTLERIYRDGLFITPAMKARLTNQARLILMIDSGGSMLPFSRIGRALVQTAKESGIGNLETYYFHDVPGAYLFTDEQLTEPILTDMVTARMSKASVLIFSDGGAARGRADASRTAAAVKFISQLRAGTGNVVWLNPIPKVRWRRTSASLTIRQSDIAMFELSRAGFDGAVQALKGVR